MTLDQWIGIISMMFVGTLIVKSVFSFRRSDLDLNIKDPMIYTVVYLTPAVISMILFNFQQYVVDYLEVWYVCYDQKLLNILRYVFPKIPWHCDQFFIFNIINKYDRGIIITLDFFIVFCYIFTFVSTLILDRIPSNLERLRYFYIKSNPSRATTLYGLCVFSIIIISLIFVYPVPLYPEFPVSTDDRIDNNWPVGLLSSYGVGAFSQTIIPTFGSYMMARGITMSRFRREQNRRIQ